MSLMLEVSQYGVHTAIRENEDKNRQVMTIAGNGFITLCGPTLLINLQDDFPAVMRILDEIVDEIQQTNEMLYVLIRDINGFATAEVSGTQNAIDMFQHGLAQNEVYPITEE